MCIKVTVEKQYHDQILQKVNLKKQGGIRIGYLSPFRIVSLFPFCFFYHPEKPLNRLFLPG